MRPDSVYDADANPGAAREGAGNATACVESSRFAAPSLRYGPSGDTTPPVPKQFTMAASELPAMADRRAHSLGKLQGRRQPPYTTQEKPYPRPRSRGLEIRKSNRRRRQLHLSLSSMHVVLHTRGIAVIDKTPRQPGRQTDALVHLAQHHPARVGTEPSAIKSPRHRTASQCVKLQLLDSTLCLQGCFLVAWHNSLIAQ